MLIASEFIDLGIINDQATTSVTATVQATSVTATVQATSVTATVQEIPATATVQSEDSVDDLPIAQYLRKFLQKDVPRQDLTEHITEFPQQEDVMGIHVTEEVSEPHK